MMNKETDENTSPPGQRWFDAYFERTDAGFLQAQAEHPLFGGFVCPCCGYPTLTERAGYEICPLCWWEDDGQDDPHADEVWGGPNHDYSLTEARQNFTRYRSMYRPDNDKRLYAGDSEKERIAKQAACDAFDRMRAAHLESAEIPELRAVEESYAILHAETKRKIEEGEAQHKLQISGPDV